MPERKAKNAFGSEKQELGLFLFALDTDVLGHINISLKKKNKPEHTKEQFVAYLSSEMGMSLVQFNVKLLVRWTIFRAQYINNMMLQTMF